MLSAVVCPLTLREAPRALSNLRMWDREFPPLVGLHATGVPAPDLVFSFNGQRDDETVRTFTDIYNNLSVVNSCFNEIKFTFCDLPPEKDLYVRDGESRYAPYGRKAGPNWLFYETIKAVKHRKQFIFLMETDCQPIIPNWLRRLQRACLQNEDAWVIGSHYCGVSPLHWSVARHINGNALYNLSDGLFLDFLFEEFWPWFIEYTVAHSPNLAYDCGWEAFLNRIEMEHAGAYDWIRVREILQRFRISTFVVNIGGFAELCGDYIWTRADVLRKYPNAALVHGPLARDAAHRLGAMAFGKRTFEGSLTIATDELQADCGAVLPNFSRSIWLVGAPLETGDEVAINYTLDCPVEASIAVSVVDPAGRVIGATRRFGAGEGEPAAGRSTVTLPRRLPYVKLALAFAGPSGAPIKLGDFRVKISRNGERLALTNRILQA